MKYNFKQETDTAKLPTRHTAVSAGVDFYADEEIMIRPGKSGIVSTGISWNPETKYISASDAIHMDSICLIIQSRSGYAFKHGIEASNAGVIDQDYVSTEENKAIIKVKLYNHSQMGFTVQKGDKICQGVPQLIPYFSDVETLDDTRNGKGFGSSDEKEKKSCSKCEGSGFDIGGKLPGQAGRFCKTCKGTGMVPEFGNPLDSMTDYGETCEACGGTGISGNIPILEAGIGDCCPECNGTGEVRHPETDKYEHGCLECDGTGKK